MTAAAGLLAGSILVLSWMFGGGPAGLVYAAIYACAALPGLPIGFALFGRRHAAGWIAGALIGYGLTQLTLWAILAARLASAGAFVAAWLAVTAGIFAALRRRATDRVIVAAGWTKADTRALLLVLLLVPAIMGLPYANLGKADPEGNRYYRAYFTADFLWHSALAYELGKFALPPRNPYMTPRPMNYYWTYFLLPATVAQVAPPSLPAPHDVQHVLKVNAFLSGLLMVGALFLLVRSGVRSPAAAGIATTLAIVAASAEGTYAIVDLMSRGRPLAELRDLNVDAVTSWYFGGLRIDNIPRSLWYTPQHTVAVALGLCGLLAAAYAGAKAPLGAIAGAGLALGLATTMNPLIGAVCAAIYGACIVVDALTQRDGWKFVVRHAAAAVPVVLAVLWGAASRVMDGAGSALDVGFSGFSRHSPVITLLLSLGPVLIPALAGLRRPASALRPVVIAASGIAIGLFLLYFVRISEASWVGFRAGQILLVSIPVLLARTFDGLSGKAQALLCAAVLIAGLPTTVVDTYNAQDIGNRRPSPGQFKWTLWTTPAQQEAFAWIRRETRDDAIVQMEPVLRGREHWTLIPSFAGRRMAAGLPISLLPSPEYTERSNRVRTLFATPNADEASAIGRKLRIDYLYVDRDDRAAYPEGTRKFDEHPALFEAVFRNAEVTVYRVR
jgi:hypothetical protein